MLLKPKIASNKLNLILLLFISIMAWIHYIWKPSLVYDKDGSFRPFGVGYRHKTIFPIWLVVILVAIFSYCVVLGYLWFG